MYWTLLRLSFIEMSNVYGNVSISYFDPFDVFASVKKEFIKILSFENVHWKSPNGTVKTVNRLSVDLFPENDNNKNKHTTPYIKFIVINCISVDEYRAKVRPLLREWLPSTLQNSLKGSHVNMESKPIILLYANSEVIDSTLFKSVSLLDKFAKDFPDVQTLELRSVYKSPKERDEFWSQLSHHLKNQLINTFQRRLDYLKNLLKNSNTFERELLIRENLFELISSFELYDEGIEQLNIIKDRFIKNEKLELPKGNLEVPFELVTNVNRSISSMLSDKQLSKFEYYRYFFLREFNLLKLDNNLPTDLLTAYQLIQSFIVSIEINFSQSELLLEFKFFFFEAILKRLMSDNLIDHPLVHEIKGELLMKKRDCWLNGVLTNTDFALMDKSFINNPVPYTFEKAKSSFKDEETFHANFFNLTKELLSLFNKCEGRRQRIVDILSIEIGMLHYQRMEYERAVMLFMSCYEYYTQSNWDIIGFKILKVFVHSLVNCPSLKELTIDDEQVPVTTILSSSFLSVVRITADPEEKKIYWKKFVELRRKSQALEFSYPNSGFFDVENIGLVKLYGANEYGIEVTLKDIGFIEEVDIDFISLVVKNSMNEQICFRNSSQEKFNVDDDKHTLKTHEIIFGEFVPQKLEVSINGTTFVKEFINGTLPVINIEAIFDIENVTFSLQQARSLELGEYSLELGISNLDKVEDMRCKLKVNSLPNGSVDSLPISFSNEEQVSIYEISDPKKSPILVEYFLNAPTTSFSLQYTASFVRDGVSCKEVQNITVKCYLPISVSVEDIFKRDLFFFRFLLNSVHNDNPIIVYSSKLENSGEERYEIEGNFVPSSPVALSSDASESCFNCYKIRPKEGYLFDSQDKLSLKVKYNTLKEKFDCLITDAVLIQGDVDCFRQFEKWKLFWETKLLTQLSYDYKIFEEQSILKFTESTNISKFCKLLKEIPMEASVQRGMFECLKRVSRGIKMNSIDIDEYLKNLCPRELIVPVQLPEFEQLFSVELSMLNELYKKEGSLTIGTAVPFDVKVENLSKQWKHPRLESDTPEGNVFVFEIMTSNEWLVNGKKRVGLNSEDTEYQVSLIPLKKGYLSFPRVEITSADGGGARIDYLNAYETVLVF